MRARRFEWEGPLDTASALRGWASELAPPVDVQEILDEVLTRGDEVVLELTARFDAPGAGLESLRVDPADAAAALAVLEPELREAMEAAAANIRAVAEVQVGEEKTVKLPAGQSIRLREVPVGAAGVYAPGGRAAYPSTVLMCANDGRGYRW